MGDGRRARGRSARRRAAGLAVVAVAALAGGAGPVAETATAAVPARVVVDARSALGHATPKTVVATCPDTLQLVGTGAETSGAMGHVVLTAVVPDPTLTSVRVTAHADADGAPEPWFVRAYAVCARGLSGLELTTAESAVSSKSPKGASATCGRDKRVLGVGGEVVGGEGQAFLTSLRISPPAKTVAFVHEDQDGTPAQWGTRGYAICGFQPEGLQWVGPLGASDSTSPKTVHAKCPPDKVVLSTGIDAGPGAGNVAITAMVPNKAKAQRALATATEDQDGFGGDWSVRAHAMCADA